VPPLVDPRAVEIDIFAGLTISKEAKMRKMVNAEVDTVLETPPSLLEYKGREPYL
jgi:hypothetical protein